MPERSGHVSDVAVIIPAFEAAGVLDQSLASVAAQMDLPGEVVVVDDCSPDHTVDVARRWESLLPLRVHRLAANGGPAEARRVGIEMTDRPLLALLDADDVWLPDHLSTLVGLHRERGGLVTADVLRWLPGTAVATRPWSEGIPVPPPATQATKILMENFVFTGAVFSRDRYEAAGGFRDRFRTAEDWDLWIRMIRSGTVVHRPPHPTVLYRLTPGSASADERMVEDELAVLATIEGEITDPPSRRALTAGRRRLEAKRNLFAAYRAARRGDPWRARRLAWGALRGHPRVARRAAGMLVAPMAGAALRERLRRKARWWLRT